MTESTATHEPAPDRTSHAQKCLTFGLGGEVYGIEILKVREIIGLLRITRVPRMPEFVRGVVNLRGRIIPVVDLRVRFGVERIDDTERTCIIIVQVERGDSPVTMGLIVEEVADVIALESDAVQDVPDLGSSAQTGFLRGMGRLGENVVMLLDIDAVLSAGEIEAIRTLA